MPSLARKTIAITETRRSRELTTLITKLGGVALAAPAMREVPRPDLAPAVEALDRICRGDVAAAIFMTGVGARAFLALAADRGRRDALLAALEPILVVVRGPKPLAALKEAGVRVDVVPPEPTTEGVLAALATRSLAGALVAVQLYGDDNPALVDGLAARGARVLEIPLYEWALPDDPEPLARLIRALIGGGVDVIAFTSSPQVRHLFVVAESMGLGEALLRSLRERVVVASIGPVCTAALSARGVTSAIQPDKATMGALVHAIAEYGGTLMAYFPVFLELDGRRCVVVGGGTVAERKATGLLAAGARVTVISPALTEGLASLARAGRIRHVAREYRDGDLAGYRLAFVATGQRDVSAAVAAEGGARGAWVNAADDAAHSDFILPSTLRRGDLVIAVGTGGTSPALARAVREELEGYFTDDYTTLARVAADVRREVRQRAAAPGAAAWRRALDAEVRRLIAEDRAEEAQRLLHERLAQAGREP